MITMLIIDLVVSIFQGALSWFTLPPPPDWASIPGASMGVVFQALGSMGVWFNLPLVLTVLTAAVATRLVGVWIKIARMGASLLSGGGGNAG